ncbi:hypothetical protein HQ36_05230 [Porphyromonas gingivicanis]|uniref:Uncharacterized protein n=1 Tax=Porphyromonas gingivicanis TaxID=266762 RepID=A0A0A2G4T8_9PORP|nr:hypothetical protein [Porphyromonas gingivicanis]KGN98298.1 hypothetical protein HQ36_05230 [Porphyromonas gingivicanis]
MALSTFLSQLLLDVALAIPIAVVPFLLLRYLRRRYRVRVLYLALLLLVVLAILMIVFFFVGENYALLSANALSGGYLLNELNRGKWKRV